MKIRRAIVSVAEKMGVVDFAHSLAEMGVEIVSAGKTAALLEQSGVPVTSVEDISGFPSLFDGRLKTLRTEIHAGILRDRDDPKHADEKKAHGIKDIDLVVVNLYPFAGTVATPGVSLDEAVDTIDLGGPAMIRSAARNWRHVTVVVDHGDYARVLDQMHENDGGTTDDFRFELACKVFAHTAHYDSMVASWLEDYDRTIHKIEGFPRVLRMELTKAKDLRYGENPHQRAALYVRRHADEASAAAARKLSGLDLSFNNLLDATAALEVVKELDGPAAAVVKHTNPCGVAVGADLAAAYHAAYETDPKGAYGSAVGLNRRVDAATAHEIAQPSRRLEVIIAPAFDDDAVKVFTSKPEWGKGVRLLAAGELGRRDKNEFDIRAITGGFLRQDRDLSLDGLNALKVVTKRTPSESETADLKFAWIVCKHVKSNCMVIAKDTAAVGIDGGQMTQLDAAVVAARKAGARARGACAASDAFFWFPDALKALAEAGVAAVLMAGGTQHEAEIIEAAEELNVAVVLSAVRHFSH